MGEGADDVDIFRFRIPAAVRPVDWIANSTVGRRPLETMFSFGAWISVANRFVIPLDERLEMRMGEASAIVNVGCGEVLGFQEVELDFGEVHRIVPSL